MKVLIATDDSIYSQAALEAVKQGFWPADVQFCLCSIIGEYESTKVNLDVGQMRSLIKAEHEWKHSTVCMLDAKQEELQETFPLCPVSTMIDAGPPAECIVSLASTWRADLIVLGSHGLSAVDRMVLGSVADLVVSHAPCSVKIVRSAALIAQRNKRSNEGDFECQVFDRNAMHPNRILICIDGSANSNYALDAIAATRWERNQEFCLLTVIEQEHSLNAVRFVGTRPLVRAQKQAVNTAQKALAKQAAQLKMVLPRHKIRTLVHEGTPAQAILDYAREWSADLIILGADVANFKGGRAALGCVAECVVNRAECSVIVARPRQCDTSEGEAVEGATVTSSRPS